MNTCWAHEENHGMLLTSTSAIHGSQRLECLAKNLLHHDPQNRVQKTKRNIAAIKGPPLYAQNSGTQRKKTCVSCHAHAECIAHQRRQHLPAVAKFSDGWPHFWVQIWPYFWVQIRTPNRGPSKDLKEEMKMWSNSGPHFGVQIWTQKWVQVWTQKCGQPSENFATAGRCCLRWCAMHSAWAWQLTHVFFLWVPLFCAYSGGPFMAAMFLPLFWSCFGGYDEVGLLAFKILHGSSKLAQGFVSD